MKKWLAILLMLSMLLAFAACDSGSLSNDDDEEEVSDKEDKENKEDNNDRNLSALKKITFESVTVVDNELCKLELTELEYDEYMGYTFKVAIENKSEGKLTFEIGYAVANGMQVEAFLYTEVQEGKKANDIFYIRDLEMEANDFAKLTKIELQFIATNSDYDVVLEEAVTVYPYGEAQATEDFVRVSQEGDNILVDNEYVTIIAYDFNKDEEFGGYYLKYYVVNKTDAELWVSMDDVSVNGYMVNALGFDKIYPNNKSFQMLTIWETDLDENDIQTVEEIELTLNVHTYDDRFEDGQLVEEIFTINP